MSDAEARRATDVEAAKRMTLHEAVSVIIGQLVLGDEVRRTLLSALRPEHSPESVGVDAVGYYAKLGIQNGHCTPFPGRRPFSEADIRYQMEQFPANVVEACVEAYFACHRVGAKLAGKGAVAGAKPKLQLVRDEYGRNIAVYLEGVLKPIRGYLDLDGVVREALGHDLEYVTADQDWLNSRDDRDLPADLADVVRWGGRS